MRLLQRLYVSPVLQPTPPLFRSVTGLISARYGLFEKLGRRIPNFLLLLTNSLSHRPAQARMRHFTCEPGGIRPRRVRIRLRGAPFYFKGWRRRRFDSDSGTFRLARERCLSPHSVLERLKSAVRGIDFRPRPPVSGSFALLTGNSVQCSIRSGRETLASLRRPSSSVRFSGAPLITAAYLRGGCFDPDVDAQGFFRGSRNRMPVHARLRPVLGQSGEQIRATSIAITRSRARLASREKKGS